MRSLHDCLQARYDLDHTHNDAEKEGIRNDGAGRVDDAGFKIQDAGG